MKSLLTPCLLLSAAVVAFGSGAEAHAGQYSAWARYPGKPGVWYCTYHYVTPVALVKHYIIWYENAPGHCYCYNPQTRTYWGRWNYEYPQWTFSTVAYPAPNQRPQDICFTGADPSPRAPGTDVTMRPPPDLPPV